MKTSLKIQLSTFTLARLVVNTSQRMIYPFLAVFAGGMKVEIGTISLAMAVSMASGAIGPFIAPVADRRGRKTGMLIGMAIFIAGMLAASLFPSVTTFFIAIICGSLGNNVTLPAMQAYLGDHTPYEKRGFYLAIIELSWALSFIAFVPLMGLILENSLWNVPFIVLAVAGSIMALIMILFIPKDTLAEPEPLTILKDIKKVITYPPALFAMCMGFTFLIGNEMVNVVFGVWMQDAYGLQIAALGAASAAIGFSELAGEFVSAFLADKIGKEKAIAIGFISNSIFVVTLPLLGKSMIGAFIWLFLFFFTFEICIISALPLMTEVIPGARATMMALFVAALSLGRALGDVLAPWLYQGGMIVNALVCFVLNFLSLFLLSKIKLHKEKPVTGK